MVPTTSSNRCISTVLLSMIGSGVPHGMHGTHLGIGGITPVGGTTTTAGHMIGTGATATPTITTITTARSVPDVA